MKVFVVFGFLGVFLPMICGDALQVASETMEKFLKSPKMSKSKDKYHMDVIREINAKMYYRKAKQPIEKRIRNILLNQYVVIPNDRKGNVTSSMVKLMSGNRSTFFIYNGKTGKQIVEAHSPDSACIFGLSQERTAVKAKACRTDVPNMRWELIPNRYGDFWIRQAGTNLCITPVRTMSYPTLVQLLRCDRYDPYMVWEITDAYLYYK